ncbi:MAG: A/G-specific adenine glycosylase [Phycisphaerales bacterium]|nr:A/G-specific adenine glycosylase [Phycisphaerales bacterium]
MSVSKKYFTKQLTNWHSHTNERSLPWKEEKDPYKIWLSEIILQQTRAEQGLQYYLSFTEKYPSICDLANAKDEDAFRLWQGLGYYNRCKNMLATARYICEQLSGQFPDKYEDILALKGVGAYTAAAIASFAFGLPYAVVDGNVYRVLSRYFGMEDAIDSTEGKRKFAALAHELLDTEDAAAYNQAIMDLGATVCTPKQSKCDECPLQKKCIAFKDQLIHLLPVKEKKMKVQGRFFNFLLFQYQDEIWIERRADTGIWQNLHQFYLIESEYSIVQKILMENPLLINCKSHIISLRFANQYKQRLTHQLIESKFYLVELKDKPDFLKQRGLWIRKEQSDDYAFPKTIVDFLQSFLF